MSSLDQDDIEVDCAAVDELHSVHDLGLTKQWRKGLELERNDSGFQSQEFDSVKSGKFDSKTVQETTLDCISETTDSTLTECFGKLQVCVKSEKLLSVDEGYDSTSVSLGSAIGCVADQIQCRSPPPSTHKNALTCESVDIYTQDDDGDTQLHMAIIQIEEPVAQYFISKVPQHDWLNLRNTLAQTALHLAVITRQLSIVRRLMVAGASVDMRDLHGNTPLHIACREGYEEIVQILLKPVYYQETLQNTYEIPYQRIPQDLEYKNYDGHTCLHLAAHGLHIDVMKYLLGKGAKVNAQDGKSGRTVLHHAAESGNQRLLEFVLNQRKVNINCITYGGLTPVALAAGRSHGDVVQILKDFGADVSSLFYNDDDSDDDSEMYDDFYINGEPVSLT